MFPSLVHPPPYSHLQFPPFDRPMPGDSLQGPPDFNSQFRFDIPPYAAQRHHTQSIRQHAFPVHQRSDPRASTHFPGHARQQTSAEHTLRRKTPNGTLAAGYDGTPVDKTVQLPAAKHIVVSSPETSFRLTPGSLMAESYFENGHEPSKKQHHPRTLPYLQDLERMTGGSASLTPDGGAHGWCRTLHSHGMDSVLNQTLPMQPTPRYHLHNGPSVPTVLPTNLQPSLGPTASAGGGPYGPYWPNGQYIPYRPAATRNSHFHAGRAFPPGSFPDPNFFYPGPSSPYETNVPGTPGSLMPLDGSWNPGPPHPHFHNMQHPPPEVLHRPDLPARSSYRSFEISPENARNVHHGPPSVGPGFQRHGSGSNRLAWQPNRQESYGPFSPGHIRSRSSGHVEFKERVLSWAHSVYVDLLATVQHHARKSSHHRNSHDGHHRSHSKPNIYPKPPRQPGTDFTNQHHSHEGSAPSKYSINKREHEDHHPSQRRRLTTSGVERPEIGSRSQQWSSHTAAIRQSHAPHDEAAINAKASSALDMLTNLCEESQLKWIDGMLLAGCLAYGLRNYDQALNWYQNILDLDKGHVEAMSNLAATLLALNRNDEAIEHWSRAIQMRPAYFEAVEHLIGLLCSTHKTKDAVSLIEYVEKKLKVSGPSDFIKSDDHASDSESDTTSQVSHTELSEKMVFDYDDTDEKRLLDGQLDSDKSLGRGSSGYKIPACDNGRMLSIIHAKGNMLYTLGDNAGAATAFEEAILIGTGKRTRGMSGLIMSILGVFADAPRDPSTGELQLRREPILLLPEKTLQTAKLVFGQSGVLPGVQRVPDGMSRKAAIATVSNCLLSLAKIYQDSLSNTSPYAASKGISGVRDILALYYLSMSLQPSPSTANNVGILLASVQQGAPIKHMHHISDPSLPDIPGIVPGSGIALALAYYNFGLNLDARHAHLYTNLGSLLKDIGQLSAAIKMYEHAVHCDGTFDIALANLANAVKDQGRIKDAISYYRRAVAANNDFAEAVCGLANALNSVCGWQGRGGVSDPKVNDRWHVDDRNQLVDARGSRSNGASGWVFKVVEIVVKQLQEGESWGRGILHGQVLDVLLDQITAIYGSSAPEKRRDMLKVLSKWAGQKWEGARTVKLVERATKQIAWQWYQDRHVQGKRYPSSRYARPRLPAALASPNAPTVLPFHTFTCPLTATQIRQISQRNGLRISCAALRSSWLPSIVYRPPPPPNPHLNVGYVSSDFNNHPLAHLMQSVFGFHNPDRVKAFCYATTASDNSTHRRQIEREAPVFYDASGWPVDRLVQQIVNDEIHILINLNGYTRGARNEVFAARPCPIQMSFMGFAGTLGAEWCDYLFTDELSIPPGTLSPHRLQVDIEDRLADDSEDTEDWVYSENMVYSKATFFCCDHKQSAPDAKEKQLSWAEEQERRWKMRKELFPGIADDCIILGNFNQLYKIEPTTFRTWLRILSRVPKAVLWLLRFPDLGEQNLRATAAAWAGPEVASRIIFTDVAPKSQHIARARVLDLFLDTPECNAHTTAADTLWSGTPLLTLPRYDYKMCSRMASSILSSALPDNEHGRRAAEQLIATTDEDYENRAVRLAAEMTYEIDSNGFGNGRAHGRLFELRRMLYGARWTSRLFDTRRWTQDVETAYERVWDNWVKGKGGDIWL